nr:MAG TPA: hypothetical protein [Caudoviricetes sp.]
MTWVSEQTKKEILDFARSGYFDQDGDFAIYNGREYYVNVRDRVVKPIIKHPF